MRASYINHYTPGMDWINNIDVVFEAATIELKKLEENLLKQVLFQLLGREATTEDVKNCTKYYVEGEPLDYSFGYMGNVIGYIKVRYFGTKMEHNF